MMFNINYKHIKDINTFHESYLAAQTGNGPTILEVQIDDADNIEIYEQLRSVQY